MRWFEPPGGGTGWRRLLTAAAASVGAVAVVTLAIALFKPYVPVLSLGVLYVFAVLPVAVVWGLGFALPVSVASMLAFNWFFLPPVHTLTLADSENWFALAVYLGTAVVVSELAARSRRRAAAAEQRERESALLADIATELLRGTRAGRRARRGGEPRRGGARRGERRIELGAARRPGDRRLAASARGRRPARSGRSTRPRAPSPSVAVRHRFLPALASLLAVAVERDGSSARRSRPRRCGAATSSRPRCCGRCRTTCARR